MKKEIIILIAGLIVIGAVVGNAVAEDYIIETETSVNGTGSFDIDLGVQTERGFAGKKLSETYYTRWMGTDGDSKLQFNSALEIFMGNCTEHNNESVTDIAYGQTALSSNAKHDVCFSNYDVGASVGFRTKDNSMILFEGFMEDNVNSFEMEGTIVGHARMTEKVVDPTTGIVYLDKDIRLDGRYDFASNHFAEKTSYPERELGDWLGCP